MTPSTAQRQEWSQRLAKALIGAGYVPEETVMPLVAEAAQTDTPLATLLVARGVAGTPIVVNTLAQLARLPVVDLASTPPTDEAFRLLPTELGGDHQAIGAQLSGDQLLVCFAEPPEEATVTSLSDLIGYRVVPALGDPLAIARFLGGGPGAPPPPPADAAPAANARDGAAAAPAEPAGAGANGRGAATGMALHVDDLLRYAVGIGASDLHLTANMPPTVRLHGALRPIEDVGRLDNVALREMIFGILPQVQRERFEADHELDTSHSIVGVGRFRVNIALQRGTVAAALRPIPHQIPEFASLGLPDVIQSFCDLRRGLVLVTGPTGSGKSTSLASLIDIINRSKPLHIVTVEDPIEFLHDHKRSIISQREVGSDTESFSEALRRVLRQDPDVILVGELRDLETISTALTAAETGHLVFATLHTQDAPSTIDRIIDVFPPNQQDQIRIQLGSSLQGVVTQQLVPTMDGQGRCVASEVLVCTPAIQNLIRGAKTHQIYSLMQTGGQFGMQTMDQSLALLVRQNVISRAVALDRCRSEEDFRNHLQAS